MNLYIYRMISGPWKGTAFSFRADSPYEAAIKAQSEAAMLKGKFKAIKSI